jgi:hypothetical protein
LIVSFIFFNRESLAVLKREIRRDQNETLLMGRSALRSGVFLVVFEHFCWGQGLLERYGRLPW